MIVIRQMLILIIIICCGCATTDKKVENKTQSEVLYKVLAVAENFYSKRCIKPYPFHSKKTTIIRYDNYLSYKNDYIKLLSRELPVFDEISSEFINWTKFFNDRYEWLKEKYENRPFWFIYTELNSTNTAFEMHSEGEIIFIDDEKMELIPIPYNNYEYDLCDNKEKTQEEKDVIKLFSRNLAEIKDVVEKNGIEWCEKRLKNIRSMMDEALWRVDTQLAKYLIKKGHKIGYQDLKAAVIGGMVETVDLMMKKNISLKAEEYIKILKQSDIYYQPEITKILEIYDKKYTNGEGWFAYYMAIRNKEINTVEKYINDPAYGTEFKFKPFNETPLMLSLLSFNYEMVKYFIGHNAKIDVDGEKIEKILFILAKVNASEALEIGKMLKERKFNFKDYTIEYIEDMLQENMRVQEYKRKNKLPE